ncbi:MAG: hypothetical protein J6K14_08655 [Clostridia bacterium]|nr:hypothetical protein [Clostridia bacterium]
MRSTKKVTLSAMMCALSVVVLTLGAVFEAFDLTAAALASICITFINIEIGAPYTFIAWICTTLLSFLFFPQSMLWIEYLLLFGLYPVLKGYIEKLPRLAWWPIKLPLYNLCLFLMAEGMGFILGVDFFGIEGDWRNIFSMGAQIWWESPLILLIIANIAFVAYDLFLTMATRVYMLKYRPRLQKYLK